MNDFQALISSLGESIVTYIGKEHLDTLTVFGDSLDMTALVEIGLNENTWESQEQAIDQMIEVRELFLDEISIAYRFVTPDSSSEEAVRARRPDFCMA